MSSRDGMAFKWDGVLSLYLRKIELIKKNGIRVIRAIYLNDPAILKLTLTDKVGYTPNNCFGLPLTNPRSSGPQVKW